MERLRADERRHAALLQERAVERAQIEARASRLDEDQLELDRRLTAEAARRDEVLQALRSATETLQTAEIDLTQKQQQHADAKAADAALRDRHATASHQAETLKAELSAWRGRIEARLSRPGR